MKSRLFIFSMTLLAASSARAWSADTHESIARAAFQICPVAAARVPADQISAFLREVREPDAFDRMCERHRGPSARLDAAVEAEKAFRELTAPAADTRPYNRARLIARYLHYAADCVVPAAIADGKSAVIPDFFANKNFAVFRQARPLAVPISASLREAGSRAVWADDAPGAYSAVFRQAVNLSIDALLALPGAREGASGSEPVLIVVNRLDSGTSTSRISPFSYDRQISIDGQSAVVRTYGELREGGEGVFTPDIVKTPGLHIVEWSSHTSGDSETVTALLYNHQEYCASGISLKAGRWSGAVSGEILPEHLCLVALQAPAGTRLPAVRASWSAVHCNGAHREGLVDARNSLIVEGGGISAPRFESARPPERERAQSRILSR